MPRLTVRLLEHREPRKVEEYLRLYARCFHPDERLSRAILRRILQPSPERVNPVHAFAAYLDDRLVGGAITLVLPSFGVVFGSYLFVDPHLRRRRLGARIMQAVTRHERQGAHGENWRIYGEVTANSGAWWHESMERFGFRFFRAPWPMASYDRSGRMLRGRLCYLPLRTGAPPRFSQPAMLAFVHALFYGPETMHRYLLPRLKEFVPLEA
ncbi:MAG TPA: GNAT family N-acetyltransferase [Terriglobia bacterium]|nr:GNAT family N-acetyltransferase [Terriglobia bacterium]